MDYDNVERWYNIGIKPYMVTSYFDPGTKLIYAIGAVVGLIGGIKVYNKFVRREVA